MTRAFRAARRSPYRLWLTPQRPREPKCGLSFPPCRDGDPGPEAVRQELVCRGRPGHLACIPPSCPACSGADGQMAQCPPLASFFSLSLTSKAKIS